ncbi:tRNA 5-methylaminomethyl-2-thiouridine synthase TusA [Rubellimicrobium mesophilum DSM 19309]|uniref:tRNA 5-methylaminomethyl-2-thiouridine synthase TusA n=1 Tax=Rubellimicrobium mesophilum DSM 19309 TaxID=442562 RepID=A0A017HSM5_9RHOB|nr:sulfurtransferase TusA family protein [Rubellimicrobium mesophilum]EYD76759.1 tRNA 5-methylaminomethyl-2-thiouridine synthase TusA [Rubellimicrobium mesophilum DSM 19309]
MTSDREVDARGLICPLPVLRARKVLLGMQPGEVLRVLATDPMAAIDLPHFCVEAGHEHLGQAVEDGAQVHLIRRGVPKE